MEAVAPVLSLERSRRYVPSGQRRAESKGWETAWLGCKVRLGGPLRFPIEEGWHVTLILKALRDMGRFEIEYTIRFNASYKAYPYSQCRS